MEVDMGALSRKCCEPRSSSTLPSCQCPCCGRSCNGSGSGHCNHFESPPKSLWINSWLEFAAPCLPFFFAGSPDEEAFEPDAPDVEMAIPSVPATEAVSLVLLLASTPAEKFLIATLTHCESLSHSSSLSFPFMRWIGSNSCRVIASGLVLARASVS